MRKTLRQQFAKVDNLASRSHLKENIAYQVICSSEPNNWPERSEAESKEPAIYLSLLLRDSSTSLGITERSLPFSALLFADQRYHHALDL